MSQPSGFQMPKPVLAIEGLTVSFDGFKAVDDLNLYIDRNEVRVVIGPNGAGKTTVLDLICGKTKATAGSIQFENRELTKMREFDIVRAGVGRKFQNPSIYENLTVFENLEMSYPKGRKVFGALFFKRSDEVVQRVHEVAADIFLGELLQQQATPENLARETLAWLDGAEARLAAITSDLAAGQDSQGVLDHLLALSAEVEDLKSGEAAVEDRARSELGMVKPGEVFYRVVEPTPAGAEPAAAESERDP